MAEEVSAGLSARTGRRFGFTVGAAFLVFALIAAWRDHPTAMRVLVLLGAILVMGGLLAPAALQPVERAWMAMAHSMSRVTTPIVMGVLFYLIITPIGLARRAIGRHGLPRIRHGETAWHARGSGTGRSDLNRQF